MGGYGFINQDFREIPILIGRNPVFDEYQVIFEEYKKKFKLIPKEDVI